MVARVLLKLGKKLCTNDTMLLCIFINILDNIIFSGPPAPPVEVSTGKSLVNNYL